MKIENRFRDHGSNETMLRSIKSHWRALKASRPGRRFRDRYERHRKAGKKSAWSRIANLALAGFCLVVGLALTVHPGPAVLFFFIGASLLATESRALASGLDRLEEGLRSIWLHARRWWQALPQGGKALAGGLALLVVGATLRFAYRWVIIR